MNVTIIGAGNMGRGIGHRLVEGGHSVTLVDTDNDAANALAVELRSAVEKGAQVKVGSLESAEIGDVVILAVSYGVNKTVARQLGSKLDGRVVIDIANPMNATYDGRATESDSSSAEEVAAIVPSSARVVKAFNTTFARTLVEGKVAGVPLDVFIAGDDARAKELVAQLVRDGGMVPIDVGQLARARDVEAMGFLHIVLQSPENTGFGSAIKLIRPN